MRAFSLALLSLVLATRAQVFADAGSPPAASSTSTTSANADQWAPYEHWITGNVYEEQGVLLFRTDKPVVGDSMKNVVVLGATHDGFAVMIPLLERVAERKIRVRLFGALLPNSSSFASHPAPLPNVEFIVWKMHMPDDPDVMPADQRIHLENSGSATMGGKPVQLIDDKTGKPFEPAHMVPADSAAPLSPK